MPNAPDLKSRQVNIRLNLAQFNKLNEVSKSRGGVPKSQLIREAIHLYIKDNGCKSVKK